MAFTEPDYQLPVEPIPGGVTLGLSEASSLSDIAAVARQITQLGAERKSIAKALGLLTDVDPEQHAQDVIINGLYGRELAAYHLWRQGYALPTLRVDPVHPYVIPTNPSKLTLLEDYRRVLMDLYKDNSVTLEEAAKWRVAYPDFSPLVDVLLRLRNSRRAGLSDSMDLTPTQFLEYRAAKTARARIAGLKALIMQGTHRHLASRRQLQDCEEAERLLTGIVERLGARLPGRRVRHLPPAQPISAARGPTNMHMHLERPVHIDYALATQGGRLPRVPIQPAIIPRPAPPAPSHAQAPTYTPIATLSLGVAPRPDDIDSPSRAYVHRSGKRVRSITRAPEPAADRAPSPSRVTKRRTRGPGSAIASLAVPELHIGRAAQPRM